IARRIFRTARRVGMRTVAMYSDADALLPFVREADAAIRIGPAPAAESYLAIDRVIAVAREAKADLVHPGYGFLAERPEFASAVDAAGMRFVGPPASVLAVLGDKGAAKGIAERVNVAVLPGYRGEELADERGTVGTVGDRDCSAQRRHQKIVEEAPAPTLGDAARERMAAAAIAIAREAGYRNAGTVEFVVDEDGAFYFLEVNARLQVEHPVTEMVFGVDLVEQQLRITQGDPLDVHPKSQGRLHAVEARVYAEDPAAGFLPSTGRLVHVSW